MLSAVMAGTQLQSHVEAAPQLIEHVSGYTLQGTHLVSFDAMAFDGGRVLAMGKHADLHRRYPGAIRVNGKGACLLPGLIDAHGHVQDLGLEMVRAQLWDTSSLAAAQAITLGDTARLLRLRGQAMQRAVPVGEGAMASLIGRGATASPIRYTRSIPDDVNRSASDASAR